MADKHQLQRRHYVAPGYFIALTRIRNSFAMTWFFANFQGDVTMQLVKIGPISKLTNDHPPERVAVKFVL